MILTEKQLNDLSKEEIIDRFLDMQNRFSILEERVAAINANTYGHKSEKLSSVEENQISIMNEIECVFDGTEYDDGTTKEETETEEITYTRRKSKGKREMDLSNLPKVEVKVETIKSKRLVEKGCKKPSPPKKGLFKGENKRYNLRGAGRHEIALPL